MSMWPKMHLCEKCGKFHPVVCDESPFGRRAARAKLDEARAQLATLGAQSVALRPAREIGHELAMTVGGCGAVATLYHSARCDQFTAAVEADRAARSGLGDLARLRAAGWTVAVHNDYKQNGELFTFWLFTHPDGRWLKGEGRTDAEALARVVERL
jgi:hypothetical protein